MTKVGLVSLGCPKNLVDSEVMLGHLRRGGYELTPRMSEAEVLVVNTCGFIEPAKRESIAAILEAAAMKQQGACRRLVVAGCMVERYRDELLAEIPEIDAVLGTRDVEHILRVVASAPCVPEGDRHPLYLYDEHAPRVLTTPPGSAYLKISEGCDHACAFCAIPRIRGPQRSRTIPSILAEARRLVAEGIQEINLVGQDTTDFGRDLGLPEGLATLIRELGRVEGLPWVRVHYTYPNRLTEAFLAALAETDNCCKYLDMPLQHADRGVLRAMGRGGGAATFLKRIRHARRLCPDLVLRSNFIVGFPGEDETAFHHLLDFVFEARFDHVGAFTYSPEEGTPAFALGDPVPRRTKERRKARLLEAQQGISRARNAERVGQVLDVLVEGPHPESDLIAQGRWRGQAPEVDGSVLIVEGVPVPGTIQRILVQEAHAYDLVGRILAPGDTDA